MEILDILTLARDDHRQVQFCDSIHAECDMNDVINLSKKISSGQFLSVASDFDNTSLSVQSLLSACADDSRPVYETVHSLALSHINNESNKAKVLKLAEVQLLGVAYLELYCQINYTGPELPPDVLEIFKHEGTVQNCVKELECDGTYAFRSIEIPQTLLLARILLSVVADPSDASWRHGIALDAEGAISRKKINGDESTCHFKEERLKLRSAHWWSVRATVIHLRLLQKQSYEDVPTLWQEVCDRFQYVLEGFSSMAPDSDLLSTASFSSIDPEQVRALAVAESHLSLPTVGATEEVVDAWPLLQRQLATQAWLEWGLCCLHFGYGDKGKKCFAVAQETAGLQTYMTASMGKRTKHQHSEYAQLFLYAKSSLMASGCDSTAVAAPSAPVVDELPPPPTVQVTPVTAEAEGGETKGEGWEHSEWEMGRRLVREGADGEEIAVREVMLDSMDGGAAQNIVLEGGPKFSSAGLDKGGALHPVDQAIILALCLDVSNSNPVDGLTNEEMQPYVERVLELASNWMIHSTGLLERSWLEFERRKTMDRAMLQIQALIDQHTTKLTITQSTFKSIEESAPAQDRLRYLYSIVYPAQYELKRDLAIRYLRCQVFMSALNYFRELEMWDEVVTCYQLMDKPHRAELVVREQLAKSGETPYMLTSLADLTRKEEYYNRAWELSKGRFPRAKRTLGKICYDRGDFAECIENLDAALSVHPLVATAWYLKGLACMRLERWDEAVQSFVRCVQQDMEIGEAWANIGAVNMRLRSWPKAYEALNEALKHKHDNWRILENLMTVALAMGKWRDVIRFMQRLLDLRLKSERPLHKDELRHLCYIVSSQGQREAKLRAKAAAAAATADPATVTSPSVPETPEDPAAKAAIAAALISLREVLEDDPEFDADDIDTILEVQPLPDLVVATDKLLTNITGAVPSDAEVWDVFAEFQHTLGRFREELDCRTKQFRRLSSEAAWEKHPEKIAAIAAAAKLLARAHHFKGVKKTDFYTCKMILQTVQRRLDSNTFESPEEKAVIDRLITKFSNIYDSM